MEKGYLAIVLHAHLPYVRHPEHEFFLEEHWLFEALTETYLPLIEVFDKLIEDRVDFRITLSLSPTLLSMLKDPLLQFRYLRHLDKLLRLAEQEMDRTRWQPEFHKLALLYHHRFQKARFLFADRYRQDLLQAFKRYQDLGVVELITCGATHGYLPLTSLYRPAIRAQVGTAVTLYRSIFGQDPKGFWLPECGYHPGDDDLLKEFRIKYFFVDTHGILFGSPRPKFGVFAPVYCRSGVACFGRDMESSKSVWSAVEGYPGHPDYREFYRDIGYDLDFDYIRPYISPDGHRMNTGIKYYKITGETGEKAPYVPEAALEKAAEHAGNFMFNREKQVEHLESIMRRQPIVVAPYDAELFGHWWFEGPDWLNFLIRKIHYDQKMIKLITPSEYLKRYPKNQVMTPSLSSWGWKGYSEVWLEGSNDWIYRHLHKMTERMVEAAKTHKAPNPLERRVLNQMARELLLAQSSDWAFILKTGTFVSYANRRLQEHTARFDRLYHDLKHHAIDAVILSEIEGKDPLFPQIDYRLYAS